MGVYIESLKNKVLAAKILLPLMEFEFSLVGDDSPTLLQSKSNLDQLKMVFEICQSHNWTNSNNIMKKGSNFYFRLTNKALKEIYDIAGPFVSKLRNQWTTLITDKSGKKGGYQVGKLPTEEKILALFKNNSKKTWTVEEACLKLWLTPSTIRKSFLKLYKQKLVERNRNGKSIIWNLR